MLFVLSAFMGIGNMGSYTVLRALLADRFQGGETMVALATQGLFNRCGGETPFCIETRSFYHDRLRTNTQTRLKPQKTSIVFCNSVAQTLGFIVGPSFAVVRKRPFRAVFNDRSTLLKTIICQDRLVTNARKTQHKTVSAWLRRSKRRKGCSRCGCVLP
eukprot:COSAG06_NODE_64_length_26790_cov_7.462291_15_plen_159_part_00